MAKTEHCPICNVAVKPENLLRHLDDIHPRHPDVPALRQKLREEPGRVQRRTAGPPIRVRRWQVVLVVAIVLGGVGAYYLAQALSTPPVFPCIGGEGGQLYHWHTDLEIFSGPALVTIPANIGLNIGCIQPLHTHDSSGRIHVESDVDRLYSLGDFYAVWRKPFGSPFLMHYNETEVTPSSDVILYNDATIQVHYTSFTA